MRILLTLIERSYTATTRKKLPLWWHLLWIGLAVIGTIYFILNDTGYYLGRTAYDIVVITLFSVILLLFLVIKRYKNKTNFLWGLTGLAIGMGMLILGHFWFWQYFINPPMVFSDWSHVFLFGCEQTVLPNGEIAVIFYCPPVKLALGNLYKIVTYPLGWIILGILIGKVKEFFFIP